MMVRIYLDDNSNLVQVYDTLLGHFPFKISVSCHKTGCSLSRIQVLKPPKLQINETEKEATDIQYIYIT